MNLFVDASNNNNNNNNNKIINKISYTLKNYKNSKPPDYYPTTTKSSDVISIKFTQPTTQIQTLGSIEIKKGFSLNKTFWRNIKNAPTGWYVGTNIYADDKELLNSITGLELDLKNTPGTITPKKDYSYLYYEIQIYYE